MTRTMLRISKQDPTTDTVMMIIRGISPFVARASSTTFSVSPMGASPVLMNKQHCQSEEGKLRNTNHVFSKGKKCLNLTKIKQTIIMYIFSKNTANLTLDDYK